MRCPRCKRELTGAEEIAHNCLHCGRKLRDLTEEEAAQMGNSLKEVLAHIKSSDPTGNAMSQLAESLLKHKDDPAGFADAVMVGACPACGSEVVSDCKSEKKYNNDTTIGQCFNCGQVWCLECLSLFKKGQNVCGHWEICDSCEKTSAELPYCEIDPMDCAIISKWRNTGG